HHLPNLSVIVLKRFGAPLAGPAVVHDDVSPPIPGYWSLIDLLPDGLGKISVFRTTEPPSSSLGLRRNRFLSIHGFLYYIHWRRRLFQLSRGRRDRGGRNWCRLWCNDEHGRGFRPRGLILRLGGFWLRCRIRFRFGLRTRI